MKIEITEQKKNPLMKREEYVIRLDHAGKPTPSRQEILKELAKNIKHKEELIIVDSIFTKKGSPISGIRALAYSRAQDIPKGKLEKMKSRMEKKAKPAAAVEEVIEAPKEEAGEAKEEASREEAAPENKPETAEEEVASETEAEEEKSE